VSVERRRVRIKDIQGTVELTAQSFYLGLKRLSNCNIQYHDKLESIPTVEVSMEFLKKGLLQKPCNNYDIMELVVVGLCVRDGIVAIKFLFTSYMT